MTTFPRELLEEIKSGRCVLFVGAGIGVHLSDKDGKNIPNGDELAKEICRLFTPQFTSEKFTLGEIAQVVINKNSRDDLETHLRKRLSNLKGDDAFNWLIGLPWKAIYTTNYDDAIENAFDVNVNSKRKAKPISTTQEYSDSDIINEVPVYHVHGYVKSSSDARLLIAKSDFSTYAKKRSSIFALLRVAMHCNSILYIGYSNKDPDWEIIRQETEEDFCSKLPRAYRVAPSTTPIERELLDATNIHTIDCSLNNMYAELAVELSSVRYDSLIIEKAKARIPSELHQIFDNYPSLIDSLVRSWCYLNAEPLNGDSNVAEFLSGGMASWGLISSGDYMQRDAEIAAYEEALDFATDMECGQKNIAILGPAGYGTSTILKSLALKLSKEGAGTILYHKEYAPINVENIVSFLEIMSGQTHFLFIDNATSNIDDIIMLLSKIGERGIKRICVIVGDRLNQWRYRAKRIRISEHIIEPLSEGEAKQLIALLEKYNKLGHLEALDYDARVRTIMIKHEKQLLVAMKEATEGREFDAIIESEYHAISNKIAQEFYNIVCICYRFRLPIRDQVISDILSKPLSDIYATLGHSLAGVVEPQEIDTRGGIWVSKSRHPLIAEIVIRRCIGQAHTFLLQKRILAHLNLNFSLDVKLLNEFIQDKEIIDSAKSLDEKTNYFDQAVKQDPDSLYVRQHYALMLYRSREFQKAQEQIEIALSNSPNTKILLHTKGVILRGIALDQSSIEIGRRMLVKSEQCFDQSIKIYDKDSYDYQSKAELYLGWAQKLDAGGVSNNEVKLYIEQAERTVHEGLRIAKEKSDLWIVSSKIKKFIGDKPAIQQSLMDAIRANSASPVARYLLARTYYDQKEYNKCVQVLTPVISESAEAFRAHVLFAWAQHRLGMPSKTIVKQLRSAEMYGLNDPRYVATLLGLYFIDGEFSKYKELLKTPNYGFRFTAEEMRKIEFVPHKDNSEVNLIGNIIAEKPGFFFIQVEGYPDIYASRNATVIQPIKVGLKVRFSLAFTPRGACATSLSLAGN